VRQRDGHPIRIADVARVKDGEEEGGIGAGNNQAPRASWWAAS
jgi:Cu/Ag efflux pump CusA